MRSHIARIIKGSIRRIYPFTSVVSTDVSAKEKYQHNKSQTYKLYSGLALISSFFFGFAELKKDEEKKGKEVEDVSQVFGFLDPKLPYYNRNEVAEHNNKRSGVWVTYRRGVYDITKFIEFHPGGDSIWVAAGSAIDPFWNLYDQHKSFEVQQLLEEFRIGNLELDGTKTDIDDDSSNVDVKTVNSTEYPFIDEPKRNDILKVTSSKPFNAEPPSNLLVQKYITPEEFFFVRNHLPVPNVDPNTYELEIEGVGIENKTFSFKELQEMPRTTVTATLMCAGNRRNEMSQVKPVRGLSWGNAAIGNAEWTGVKLCDLLKSLGIDENTDAHHVQFEGLDCDLVNAPYGASIPLATALDPKADVLLAYEMNGKPLSRDHGYPIRVVVPGVVGARNVKWLSRIIISKEESESRWQRSDYKGFSPSVDWDNVDFSKSPAIQELPVISAVCIPSDGGFAEVNLGNTINVKGYAWSGGGRGIVRVDLTCDKGKTWQTATLLPKEKKCPEKPGCRVWDWSVWEAKLLLPDEVVDKVEVWVKAVDSSYNTQPENFENIWNLRGVLNNAYHKINVSLDR